MESPKRFVRLQSQYYEVIIDDKGLRLEPVDAMKYLSESVEKTVLGNEVIGLVEDDDNVMQKVVDSAREELMKQFKGGIKETVLACLGFEKSNWAGEGFKIDHCNQRMSTVGDLISHELKTTLMKTQFNIDFVLTEEEREELRETMRKDYAQRYASEVSRMAYSAISQLAQNDVKEVVTQLIGTKKKDIADQVLNSLLQSKRIK